MYSPACIHRLICIHLPLLCLHVLTCLYTRLICIHLPLLCQHVLTCLYTSSDLYTLTTAVSACTLHTLTYQYTLTGLYTLTIHLPTGLPECIPVYIDWSAYIYHWSTHSCIHPLICVRLSLSAYTDLPVYIDWSVYISHWSTCVH